MPVHCEKFHQFGIGIKGIAPPVDDRQCRCLCHPDTFGSTIVFVQQIRIDQIRKTLHFEVCSRTIAYISILYNTIRDLIVARENHRFGSIKVPLQIQCDLIHRFHCRIVFLFINVEPFRHIRALIPDNYRKHPHDHGRAFAVNGELSKGKARGSGLIFVLCIALVTLAVVPFKAEYVIYTVLLIASMLSGYFDDAAETAWNEYKKGLIDLVIAVVAGVTYLNFNGTEVNFLSWSFSLPYAVYLILIIVLIWASINVVNCTDGVDGLSASLAVVSIGTFLLAYWEELGDYATAGIVFIGALLAYLWQNAKPSTLLMGDAGSRAMGFFLAVLALKSSHPFAFLLAALVFIVDGSLGILKISFKRFLHISILKNTLTPLHDHVRKRLGWSDEQVVARWLILQAVASAWLLLLVR